jgi:hypothetical protein
MRNLPSPEQFPDSAVRLAPSVSATYRLTHLAIIPLPPDSSNPTSQGPWLLAVYSNTAGAAAPDPSPLPPPAASVLVRWRWEPVPDPLHSKFDDLLAKKSSAAPKVRFS